MMMTMTMMAMMVMAGKELVMNLLVLRFANVAFSSIWNRQQIKSVQVLVKGGLRTHHLSR